MDEPDEPERKRVLAIACVAGMRRGENAVSAPVRAYARLSGNGLGCSARRVGLESSAEQLPDRGPCWAMVAADLREI